LARGDVFVATAGGGGGIGDPLLRSPDKVAEDVASGYVTPEHAHEIYGVVLASDAVDVAATEARRAEIRRQRIGGQPANEAKAPPSVGISLARENGSWACASCDERLAGSDANWRDGAVLREKPIAERYAELGMLVRDRLEAPRVVMREY